MLTARGEHRPPARPRRREARQGVGRRDDRQGRARRPPQAPALGALRRPAAARGDRPGAGLAGRPSCSRTSRPATSTRRRAARSSTCCATRSTTYGQTTVMVTHDARAAAIADRILFLADGLIVQELGRSTRARDARGDGGGERRDDRRRAQGPAGRKLRTLLTALAIVLGVAMISGTYVLTDTIAEGVRRTSSPSRTKARDAVISGKKIVRVPTQRRAAHRFRRAVLDDVRALPGVEAAAGGISIERLERRKLVDENGKAIGGGGGAPTFGVGIDRATRASIRSSSPRAGGPTGAGQVAIDARHGGQARLRRRRHDRRRRAGPRASSSRDHRHRRRSDRSTRSAARRIAIFDLPTAQGLFDKAGQLDGISVAAKDGVSPSELVEPDQPARCRPTRR